MGGGTCIGGASLGRRDPSFLLSDDDANGISLNVLAISPPLGVDATDEAYPRGEDRTELSPRRGGEDGRVGALCPTPSFRYDRLHLRCLHAAFSSG